MKNKNENRGEESAFTMVQLLVAIAVIGLIALFALPEKVKADDQGLPQTFISATNLPAVVTTGAISNQTSVIALRKGQGLGLSWSCNVSSGTSNATLIVYPSVDGTNFATVGWSVVGTARNTTNILVVTNWSAAQLAGLAALNIGSMTNQNAGTLTNNGVEVNRPNN